MGIRVHSKIVWKNENRPEGNVVGPLSPKVGSVQRWDQESEYEVEKTTTTEEIN